MKKYKPAELKLKRVTLDLPVDLHREIAWHARRKDKSFSELALMLLRLGWNEFEYWVQPTEKFVVYPPTTVTAAGLEATATKLRIGATAKTMQINRATEPLWRSKATDKGAVALTKAQVLKMFNACSRGKKRKVLKPKR